jgi:hypothetical protein
VANNTVTTHTTVVWENFFLHVNMNDSWKWQPDFFEGYFVKGVYHLLSKKSRVVM